MSSGRGSGFNIQSRNVCTNERVIADAGTLTECREGGWEGKSADAETPVKGLRKSTLDIIMESEPFPGACMRQVLNDSELLGFPIPFKCRAGSVAIHN